jgi:hypothetical protein
MRKMVIAITILMGLGFGSFAMAADKAELTVIHGISGLPEAVEVYANNNKLFSFDFNQSKSLSLDPDFYFIEVKLQGATVLSAGLTLEGGKNYSAVAHFTGSGDIALSAFENNIENLKKRNVRLAIRHTAFAPAVDIQVRTGFWIFRNFNLKILNVSNDDAPGQFGEVDIDPNFLKAEFYPAGVNKKVFQSPTLFLKKNTFYIIYAIGSLSDGTFTLFIQTI